jgi:hypothetical protein
MLFEDLITKLNMRSEKNKNTYRDIYPIGRIHINDDMYKANMNINHYINVGLSALRNIEETLEIAGKKFEDVKSCLDMPGMPEF